MKFFVHRSRLRTFEGWKDVIEFIFINDSPFPAFHPLNPNLYTNNRPQA